MIHVFKYKLLNVIAVKIILRLKNVFHTSKVFWLAPNVLRKVVFISYCFDALVHVLCWKRT